jgi:hypothetical protein
MSKGSDIQELILGLRQRGAHKIDTRKLENGDFAIDLAYYAPHTEMLHATVTGMNDVAVLENALEFLKEHGMPLAET